MRLSSERSAEKMCGRYYIAPDEEEEDWEEILSLIHI